MLACFSIWRLATNMKNLTIKNICEAVGGKLYIPADLAAGLLHARLVPDAMSGRVKLFRLPENKPAVVAADAAVELRQVEARQQGPDHPILRNVPETEYLKFYIFQVV